MSNAAQMEPVIAPLGRDTTPRNQDDRALSAIGLHGGCGIF